MGYFLLFESMLDTVLFAWDKWLAPNGLIFPDRAVLFIAGIEDEKYKNDYLNYWDNVYGVRMSCLKDWALREATTDCIDRKAVITEACPILDIDI